MPSLTDPREIAWSRQGQDFDVGGKPPVHREASDGSGWSWGKSLNRISHDKHKAGK